MYWMRGLECITKVSIEIKLNWNQYFLLQVSSSFYVGAIHCETKELTYPKFLTSRFYITCQWEETYGSVLRLFASVSFTKYMIKFSSFQFAVFKPQSYCFKETTKFDVKTSFARLPVSHLIKSGDIIKEF